MTSKLPSSPAMASPEFLQSTSNFVHISADIGSTPGNHYSTGPELSVIVPSFPIPRNDRRLPHKHWPILSGLPNKVYDLSSALSTPTSRVAGGRTEAAAAAEPEPEPEPSSLTINSTPTNLSKLLSLLPRKKHRHQHCITGPTSKANEEGSEDDDETPPEDESRVVRRRGPTLKKGDEASHLRRDEREEYEKKRDERLTHYKLVDSFQLHTEQVLWI